MHSSKIDWVELELWLNTHQDEPGYDWISSAYQGWEGDQFYDWDNVADLIDDLKWLVEADDFSWWLDENQEKIDWEDFDAWAEDVEDMPGYGWLEKVFYFWREDEQKDIPEYWINDDHMIDMYYLIEYMESHKSDPEELRKWLENHRRSI